MKYVLLVAIGLIFYYMTATEMVFSQLNQLKNTYQSFDQVSQQIASEK